MNVFANNNNAGAEVIGNAVGAEYGVPMGGVLRAPAHLRAADVAAAAFRQRWFLFLLFRPFTTILKLSHNQKFFKGDSKVEISSSH